MNGLWSTPNDLKAHIERLWQRGDLLRIQLTGEPGFPLRLPLKSPNSTELVDHFDAVRRWIAALTAAPHLRLDWREITHRVLGTQRLPSAAWIDTLDDALEILGKRSAAARFHQLIQQTRSEQPTLLAWLQRRPLQALELAEVWPKLLAVIAWLRHRPRPAIYLRQVDIPGIDSKFIEAHRSVLGELLDLVLPSEAIHRASKGSSQFNVRYGFLDKPLRVRFRLLDPLIPFLPVRAEPGRRAADITLDADTFAMVDAPIRHVFITENETNFLAFPNLPASIVVFGGGYGWEALACAHWLEQCPIHYWGDIDTHGFAILNQLRERFPHVESVLMDRETLLTHKSMWGEEAVQLNRDLPLLHRAESALFDDLRDNRIRPRLRLEQERIGFEYVRKALTGIVAAHDP